MPAEMWWFIGAAGVLLAMAAALLRPGPGPEPGPEPERPAEPGPQAVALLRGGRRAAVTVALVALQRRGVVTTGRTGTVRTDGRAPTGVRDPLQLAVHTSLRRAMGLRGLASQARIRPVLDGLRDELAAAGLLRANGRRRTARALLYAVPVTVVAGLLVTPLGAPNTPLQLAVSAVPVVVAAALWCLPRRTRAGRRLLASLRERHPLKGVRRDRSEERVLISVALYGDPALRLYVPAFARDGGLLGRGGKDPGLAVYNNSSGRVSCGGGASCGA